MERKVYVLMWIEPATIIVEQGNKDATIPPVTSDRERAMFSTSTVKRRALARAKALHAKVYAIPYPGTGWDCPTINAVFTPIADYR